MIEKIFASLADLFVVDTISEPLSYYFSLGDFKKTVRVSAGQCLVEDGRTVDDADCVCKTSPDFFIKIWEEGYRPTMADFLSGTIKSSNPDALRIFLKCFGKGA